MQKTSRYNKRRTKIAGRKKTVILKTGRSDSIETDVIISSVSKAGENLLMTTAESMLSKHPALTIAEALFFLLKRKFFSNGIQRYMLM